MITRANTRFGVVICGKTPLPYLITPAPPKEPTTSFATYTKSSYFTSFKQKVLLVVVEERKKLIINKEMLIYFTWDEEVEEFCSPVLGSRARGTTLDNLVVVVAGKRSDVKGVFGEVAILTFRRKQENLQLLKVLLRPTISETEIAISIHNHKPEHQHRKRLNDK